MKRILLALVMICGSLVGYSAEYVNISDANIKIPNHWSLSGNQGNGTNFVFTEELIYTNTSNGLDFNIYTNQARAISEDYVRLSLADEVFANGQEVFETTSSPYRNITNGIVQLRSDEFIDTLLSELQTNLFFNWNWYGTDSIPTNIINIVNYPLIKTNGLIIKMYISDWTTFDELYEMIGYNAKPGKLTNLILLDQNEIYFVEAFATYDSEDLAYTTNLFRYIYADNPISRYGSYFEREPGYIQLSEYQKLYIPEGMSLEFVGGAINFPAIDIEIDLNDRWVTYDPGLWQNSSSSPLNGPVKMRWKRSDERNDLPSQYVLFELKYAELYYLQTISSLAEQLSNTVSQTETTIITNTVMNTITNTVGYTLSEVADMRYGSKMVAVSNNTANLTFRIDAVSNLESNWNPIMDITVPFDMGSSDIGFFRVREAEELTTNEVDGAASPPNMEVTPSEGIMNNLHDIFRDSTTTPDGGGFNENDSTSTLI